MPTKSNNDNIYQSQLNQVGNFKFDKAVAQVFSDMIARSVPGYAQILSLLPSLTRQFKFSDSHYYDIGCSLGAGMIAIAQGLEGQQSPIIGIDNSQPMLEQASTHLDAYNRSHTANFQLYCADINDYQLQHAGMVLMNFTLQFIAVEQRTPLLEHIYQALTPGGALVLSEKISFEHIQTNNLLVDIHHQFKADQGYSQLEISQKRQAIENVLIPETLDTHIQRLEKAGFSIITPWIQNLQFLSILAVK